MADTPIGRLVAILTLDDKQFRKQLRSADRIVARQSRQFRQLGRNLSRSITLPIVAAAAVITKIGVDFEAEMTKIETLVGVQRDQVQAWRKDLLDLGPAVGRGAGELSKALFIITSAGERGGNALEILRQAAKASAVGLGDTGEVARAVTAAMQAYQKQGLRAAQATDILVATVREGNLEASALAGSLGRVIGIASQFGVTFAQVGGFVATFTRLGVNAEEAVTALRGILNVVAKPTEEAREALAELGLTVEGLRASIAERGLAQTLVDLVDRVGDNQNAIAKIIPNVRALSGVLGTAAAQGKQFVDISEKIENSLGITNEAFETTRRTAKQAFNEARAALESFGIELAEGGLVDGIRNFSRSIKNLALQFKEMDDGTKRGVIAFGVLAAAAGPLLILLGSLGAALTPIIAGLIAIAALLGPGAAVIAGLVGLKVAVDGATGAWGKLRDAMQETADTSENVKKRFEELEPVAGAIEEAMAARGRLLEIDAEFQAAFETHEPKAVLDALIQERERLEARLQELADAQGPLTVGTNIEVIPEGTGGGALDVVSQAIADAQANLQHQFEVVEARAALLGTAFDATSEKAQLLRSAIDDLTEQGVKPSSPALRQMAADLAELNRQAKASDALKSIGDILTDIGTKARTINLDPTIAEIERMRVELIRLAQAAGLTSDQLKPLLAQFDVNAQMWKTGVDAAGRAASDMERIFQNAIENIQRSLGDMFTDIFDKGISSFKDFGNRIKDIFSRLAGDIASALVTSGIKDALASILGRTTAGATGGGGISGILSSLLGGGGKTGVSAMGSKIAGAGGAGTIAGSLATGLAGLVATVLIPAGIDGLTQIFKGKNPFTSTGAGSAALRGGGLGFGAGAGALGLSVAAGAATIGTFALPIIGTAIGALVGALVNLFDKPKPSYAQLTTQPYGTGPQAFQGGISQLTPFGMVGLDPIGTQRTVAGFEDAIIDRISDLDRAIADLLSPTEIQNVARVLQQSNQALHIKFKDFDTALIGVIGDRLNTIISEVAGAEFARGGARNILEGVWGLENQVAALTTFLQERAEVQSLADAFFGLNQYATEAEGAIAALNAQFQQLLLLGPEYGIDITGLQDQLAQNIADLTTSFDRANRDAILAILDPLALALDNLADEQARRLAEAQVLGADIVLLERRYALERERIIEQFTSRAQDLLDRLLSGPTSPLAPLDQLTTAEARFAEARGTFLAGGGGVDELVSAAEALLDVSSRVFASSEQFFERFNFVVSTLQNVTSGDLPGFQSGGSFTVGGPGGPDRVVPLFRATRGETVTVAPAGTSADARIEGMLRAIAELLAAGNADQADALREVADQLRGMKQVVGSQQANLKRLASRQAVSA